MRKICWLFLFPIHVLFAQEPLYNRAIQYTVKDGLPQNLVSGIAQDKDGFIWVSTMDGLARFDGSKFLVFRTQPGAASSLPFNVINTMEIDTAGTLWLMGQSRMSKFNSQTFKVVNSNQQISDMQWALLKSCKREITEAIVNSLESKLSPAEKEIRAFTEDDLGRLWVVTEDGLKVSDSAWQMFTPIVFPSDFQLDLGNENHGVTIHTLKDRAVVIAKDKVAVYNLLTGSSKLIKLTNPYLGKIYFGATTRDPEGRLLFESQNCIYRLEHNDQVTLLFRYKGSGIRRILVDKSNTLWIGTDPEGLLSVNLLTPRFISSIYRDEFIKDILITHVGIDSKALDKNEFSKDKANRLSYVYADKVLYLFSVGTKQNAIIKVDGKKIINVFQPSHPGELRIGLDNQFLFFDWNGSLFTWKDFATQPIEKKMENAIGNGVSDMAVDHNNLWVSIPPIGIQHYQNKELMGTIKIPGNNGANVLQNDPSNDSILWVGTYGGGLFKLNKYNSQFTSHYGTEDGLPNNVVYSFVPDSLGFFWMSTNLGISRFNPVTETFTNYTEEDGLIESEFNQNQVLELPDGRIAMAGTKGYSLFNPYDFHEDNFSPDVLITGLSIHGKPFDYKKDSTLLSDPLNQIKSLNLSHTDNSIGFELATNQFNSPAKNLFRYRLEGSDEDWVNNEFDRSIRFNNLPFGRYSLLLNASNTSGRWSSTIRKIEIVIHPPVWLTWWAYSFYALVVLVAIRIYWRIYKKRLKEKHDSEFNLREAARLKEVDEMKNRFFSNITHEFRTPLTLILSPLEKHLQDETLSPKALTLLNNNYRHASQLLKLVNQLLDIAKLEAGQMLVSPTAGELSLFMEQCVSAFRQQGEEKKIIISLNINHLEGHYLFDPDKIEKIIFNLLSNAIKFTPEAGTISVIVSNLRNNPVEKPVIEIKVADTGIGINPEKLPNIFERFYQADDSATRAHEGSGIGLALVKELVDLMEGEVFVESVVGSGTTFRVTLPMEKLKEMPAAQAVTDINKFKVEDEQRVTGIDHEKPLMLVVEDNEELRTFIKESLLANWEVMEASNGLDGWTIIERELPDIVISDVMMPGMNGFELCRKSKQDPRTSHISFIMLTAKAAQESKIEGLDSGADDYITKPFHLHELELRIRNQLLEKNNLRKHLLEKVLPTQPRVAVQHVNDVFLTKLQHYLDEHLMDSELTAENIADAMAMSQRTLNRKLNALIGQSIVDYVRKYRLQKSLSLLATGIPVNEVAHQVGFETPRYFSQCFKDHYQQTPSEYLHSLSLS